MTLKTLMDGLKTLQKTRSTSFTATARALARGEKLTPQSVATILNDAGKTAEELEAAVELATRRIEWRVQVDAADGLDKKRADIAKLADVAKKTLADAQQVFDDAVSPLDDELVRIEETERLATEAKRQLFNTASDGQRAELDEATENLSVASNRAAELRKQAKLIETAEADMVEANIYGHDSEKGSLWFQKAKAHERQGKDALAKLPDAERQVETAEAAMRAAETAMLVV
jgi:hypothetical protein